VLIKEVIVVSRQKQYVRYAAFCDIAAIHQK
jgi:hypothetical protein